MILVADNLQITNEKILNAIFCPFEYFSHGNHYGCKSLPGFVFGKYIRVGIDLIPA